MASLEIKDANGKTTKSVALPSEIFEVQVNIPLMHQVVTAQLAAARS
jgi:large subunit ribosomal protein L4